MSTSNEPATKADIENIINLIQQLAERIDQRFEAVENRLERINDNLAAVQTQMAAMTRWADRMDRDHGAISATQTAQQRAIDNLAARVSRLEEKRQNSN